MVRDMEKPQQQLSLIERADEVWRLDERTREVGRRGLELARKALEQAARSTAA